MNRIEKKRKEKKKGASLSTSGESVGKKKEKQIKKYKEKKTLLERAKNSNIQKQITLKCKKVIN